MMRRHGFHQQHSNPGPEGPVQSAETVPGNETREAGSGGPVSGVSSRRSQTPRILSILGILAIVLASFAGGWLISSASAGRANDRSDGFWHVIDLDPKKPASASQASGTHWKPGTFSSSATQPAAGSNAGSSASSASQSSPGNNTSSASFPTADQMMTRMENLQRQMDQAFQNAMSGFGMPAMPGMNLPGGMHNIAPGGSSGQTPGLGGFSGSMVQQNVSLRDDGDHYTVEINLPNQDVSNVKVDLKGQQLQVSSNSDVSHKNTSHGAQMQSRQVSSFAQSMTLPGPVQADKMKIDRSRGQVTVTIPKASK